MTVPRPTRIALALAAAITLAGCGAVGETITERAVEEGLERASVGADVDLDIDEGGVSVESSEGSLQVGGNADVPDGFPSDVPVPEGEVVASMSSDQGDQRGFNLTVQATGDAGAVTDELEAGLEAAGYELVGTGEMESGDELTRTVQFSGAGWDGNVVVADTPEGAIVSFNVAAQQGG